MRISEIFFSVPVFPTDVWDIEDPSSFQLCEHGWGM